MTEAPTETWSERFGFHLPDAVTPYPADEFPLVKAIRGHAVEAADVFIRHSGVPEGLWVSVNATPLRDEEGVLHNGVAVLHNITTHKRAEEALLKAKDAAEAANRAKSQFLANMSHELRTPLNAIIGYSEMLQEQALDSGQNESIPDLQKIHSAGRHLQSLIDDILDLSKIEAGKIELFLETFDVGDVVRDVLTTIEPLVEKNGNTLQAHYPPDLGVIRADMTRLRQILFNLLSNACKFTERGSIRLDAFRSVTGGTEWIHFRVSDTGIGMTPEQIRSPVPGVHAGRRLDHAEVRRHRARPGDQQALLGDDGRRRSLSRVRLEEDRRSAVRIPVGLTAPTTKTQPRRRRGLARTTRQRRLYRTQCW